MPNWCYNLAILCCQSKEIYDKLLASLENNTWFKTFAPLGIDEDDWTLEKAHEIWNTKWTPQSLDIVVEDETNFTLELTFNTAWSPPIGVYNIMHKEYGIITTAFYEEPGNEYFGKCAYSPEEEWDETFDYPSNKEELDALRKEIGVGSELDEFMSVTWEQLEEDWADEECEDEETENDECDECEDDEETEDDECEDCEDEDCEDCEDEETECDECDECDDEACHEETCEDDSVFTKIISM